MTLNSNGSSTFLTLALAGVLFSTFATPVQSAVIFEDGFESGNLSTTQNGFRWVGSTRTEVNSVNPRTGSRSLQFFYHANADGEDGWSEQRFALGGNYTDIWAAYDMRIPNNYYHRDQSDSANNKGFLYLWSGDYASPSGPMLGPEFWPLGDGSSKASIRLFGRGYDQHIGSGVCPNPIKLSDRGKWFRIVAHYKYASSANNDGIVQIWKQYPDGTQEVACSITNGAWYAANSPGFDSGYILGWANSGYSEDTYFYVDNFKVATHSLLDETSTESPPLAPLSVDVE